MIRPNYHVPLSWLLNREGMVFIGGILHCYTNQATIIVPNGNLDKARQAIKTGKSTDRSVVIHPSRSTPLPGGRPAASCSRLYSTADSPGGDRRIMAQSFVMKDELQLSGEERSGTAQYHVWQFTYTEGVPYKKNFWGNWVRYRTGNKLTTRFTVDFSSISTAYSTQSTSIDYSYENDWDGISHTQTLGSGHDISQFVLPKYYSWTNTYHEGSPLGFYASGGVAHTPLKCP